MTFMLSVMSLQIRLQQPCFLQPQQPGSRGFALVLGRVCEILPCSVQVSLPTAKYVFFFFFVQFSAVCI